MGDLLKTFKTALQKQMMEGQGAHVKLRGLAIPIDPFLEGAPVYCPADDLRYVEFIYLLTG